MVEHDGTLPQQKDLAYNSDTRIQGADAIAGVFRCLYLSPSSGSDS